jgi:hypothetical protein
MCGSDSLPKNWRANHQVLSVYCRLKNFSKYIPTKHIYIVHSKMKLYQVEPGRRPRLFFNLSKCGSSARAHWPHLSLGCSHNMLLFNIERRLTITIQNNKQCATGIFHPDYCIKMTDHHVNCMLLISLTLKSRNKCLYGFGWKRHNEISTLLHFDNQCPQFTWRSAIFMQ